MLPVLAIPIVAGLALSVFMGGMGMVNIERYQQQIQQRQIEIQEGLDEKFEDYEIFEEEYTQQEIDNWEGDEVTKDDISEIQSQALDSYCFSQDIDLSEREINLIKKQLPEHVKEKITGNQNAWWFYVKFKQGDDLEWLKKM